MRSPNLPIEVVERIIDSVAEFFYDNPDGYIEFQDLRSTWNACSLTCRALSSRGQYWLFRDIAIGDSTQGERLMAVIRGNSDVAKYAKVLAIGGHYQDFETGSEYLGAPSWVPLLLAPRLINLTELHLEGDVFCLEAHPSYPMALAGFRNIRKLVLAECDFANLGRCTRFIRSFSNLVDLGLRYIIWKPRVATPMAPNVQNQSVLRHPRSSAIKYLDVFFNREQKPEQDHHELISWLKLHTNLRTLSLEAKNYDSLSNILRCVPTVRSIYLILRSFTGSPAVLGFGHCAHLRSLHIECADGIFPTSVLNAIVLSISSSHLERITVYLRVNASKPIEDDAIRTSIENDTDDSFKSLDSTLCKATFKNVELSCCMFGSYATEAVTPWRRALLAALPKLASSGQLRIERNRTATPWLWFVEFRDGC